ncbi:hypothetical protein ABH994_000894 [Bradyrhizobium yuanmingense]|uniref:Secreted protein n=2 Tax=Nitrobacteraceae TaxID=41294 RepID=A0A1C3WSM0_9BRAD|nr:hypothetical protein IQ15_04902 [Bradyrhizobium yuanmingense]SCB42856.1 hypothetical protein GA0061099_1007144 [Bradyrhizobium yuanmingense]
MPARRLLMLTCLIISSMMTTVVLADPRDAVDRSHRLDTDALRDDAATRRLEQPSHPLAIAPAPAAPPAKATRKKKSDTSSSR